MQQHHFVSLLKKIIQKHKKMFFSTGHLIKKEINRPKRYVIGISALHRAKRRAPLPH